MMRESDTDTLTLPLHTATGAPLLQVLVREKPFGYQNTLDLVDIALKEAKLDYLDLVLIQSLPNILALEATSSMKSCLIPPITHRVGELPRLHNLPKGPHATFKADILALDTSKLPISDYIGLLDILSATHGTAKVLENTVPGLLEPRSLERHPVPTFRALMGEADEPTKMNSVNVLKSFKTFERRLPVTGASIQKTSNMSHLGPSGARRQEETRITASAQRRSYL
ncbi:uncharacterized protein TRIVIDRAFT_222093 [Trichoderma virens Gv29-8]|uniref:NADP-dependent oxidoreductase domain-containing protein n=1 Tax=Hypocrea virens (strain Gv29-8 / FGSC 10586) TaxID=413071 RepID=G9MRW2_HYPVG|nr:uncharacterized protein TRIVIDRAFT_222093 [Trichoderma virens Gv29-8]EHK22830.1 hypothetical protein TRIVIDRAFT_222093 [Trichoderma virens Gv29-8]